VYESFVPSYVSRLIGFLERHGRAEGDGNGDVEGEKGAADEVDDDGLKG
jgi:hypothetical protein